jgi:hypothetical protein
VATVFEIKAGESLRKCSRLCLQHSFRQIACCSTRKIQCGSTGDRPVRTVLCIDVSR